MSSSIVEHQFVTIGSRTSAHGIEFGKQTTITNGDDFMSRSFILKMSNPTNFDDRDQHGHLFGSSCSSLTASKRDNEFHMNSSRKVGLLDYRTSTDSSSFNNLAFARSPLRTFKSGLNPTH
jgi:hypothetical protein